MKKIKIFIILFFIIIPNYILSQEYGVLMIGSNIFLTSDSNNRHNVSKNGMSFGFMLPVNCKKMNIFYKVKLSTHTADSYDYHDRQRLDNYIMAVNELLVSYDININNKSTIAPQIGLGMMAESIHHEFFDGYSSAELFIDLSFMVKYSLRHFGIGLLTNYENGIDDFKGNLVSDKRLNLSLIIYK